MTPEHTLRAAPGAFRASLVLIVGVDPDGMYRLACGHRKDPRSGTMRPKRTQCRACFPNAPTPKPWPAPPKRSKT